MTMAIKRGMLIAFEGNDRVGKTTQATKLVEWLQSIGKPAQLIRFPDRSTAIGSVISQYLQGKTPLHDNAIHLLFTANRWEKFDEMKTLLMSGKTLVVDRYSFSGVAYTASKPNTDFEWCRSPEKGLLKPDCVIFLSSNIKMLENRADFGSEIYETSDFQSRVMDTYKKLKEDNWSVIDANRELEDIHRDIVQVIQKKCENLPDELGKLW